MNPWFTTVALFAGVVGSSSVRAQDAIATPVTHARAEFSFVISAPYEQVFPLFGAYEERKWAAGFDPQFVHPSPARDQQGMVFMTEQEGRTRIWTNTLFDRAAGHVQYVYFIADMMVSLIDIHLTQVRADETRVDVAYERTALRPEANQGVAAASRDDATSGPNWSAAINGYLRKAATAGQQK